MTVMVKCHYNISVFIVGTGMMYFQNVLCGYAGDVSHPRDHLVSEAVVVISQTDVLPPLS